MSTKLEFMVEKLCPQAKLPKKAHPTDSGWDLYDTYEKTWYLGAGETRAIHTGIRICLPPGWEAKVWPRSGLASEGIWVHPGTIDEEYTKEIKVIITNLNGYRGVLKKFQPGSRIAQIQFYPRHELTMREGFVLETDREGLGSTGGF